MKILRHGWNVHYGNNKNSQNKSNKEKIYLLTAIFKRTMGIYTHIDDVVSRDKHGICEWALLPLRVTLTQEKHASTGCHHCLLAPNFTQFGGYQWRR